MFPSLAVAITAAAALDAGVATPAGIFRLTGVVRELGTRDPIGAASLSCEGVDFETHDDGRFELELLEGSREVQVRASGYRSRTFIETADAGTGVDVVYRLEPNEATPYRTVVTGQKARTEAARVSLSAPELQNAAGSSGEPLRTLMQMPGVAGVASGLAYPVVRGTQPASTGYFIDGVRVPQLFHSLVGLSVLHPDFVDKIDFYPGLPPLQFGRLLGGAVDITAARPKDDRVHATVSVDLVNVSAFVSAPIPRAGTLISAAGRVSYTPLIAAPLAKGLLPQTGGSEPATPVANFWDYQLRVEQPIGAARIRAFVFGSGDVVGITSSSADQPSGLFGTSFHRADLALTTTKKGVALEAAVTVGVDHASLDGQLGGVPAYGIAMDRKLISARASAVQRLGDVTVGGGIDAELQDTSSSALGASPVVPDIASALIAPKASGMFAGAWLSLRGRWGPLETHVGVRADLFRLSSPSEYMYPAVAPRLEERLHLSEWLAVRAGAGLFHQSPTVLISLPTTDLAGLSQGLQWAAHFELGADVALPLEAELGLTAFYEPLFRSVEFRVDELVTPQRELAAPTPVTDGRAYGIELFLRRAQGRYWFGWLSATLQHSERRRSIVRYDDSGNVVGAPVEVMLPFAFDQTFVLNATFGVRLPYGFTAGLTVHFNTGRPEIGDVSSRNFRPAIDPATQDRWWVPQDLDRADRLPPFFRLDARVAKTFRLNDVLLELYLDVFNASGSSEVLSYTYSVVNPGRDAVLKKSPFSVPVILPMLGLKGRY